MDIKLLRETTANASAVNQAKNLAHFEASFPKLLALAKDGHNSFTFEGNDAFPANVHTTNTLDKLKELYPELKFSTNDYFRKNITVSW